MPIIGLAPEDIKASSRGAILASGSQLGHRRRLTAIVDRLGFRGDFGTYALEHWPAVQAFLRAYGCGGWRDLFAARRVGGAYFGAVFRPQRRQLADRIFLGESPTPSRVFLGVDSDWDVEVADRGDLFDQWGFVDDKLVAGPLTDIVDKVYHATPRAPGDAEAHKARVLAAVRRFRAACPEDGPGWVDILRIPGNDRLAFLRAQDGTWDLVWRDMRPTPPPALAEVPGHYALQLRDLPAFLAGEQDLARRLYFRRDAWDEHEAHLAEQRFYDVGHTVLQRQLATDDQVRQVWLGSTGRWPVRRVVTAAERPPAGFQAVTIGSRTLWISELITAGEYRQMIAETGYPERRAALSEDWLRANDPAVVADAMPVGATWHDAQAFCAWKERSIGRELRLPTLAELRALRPFHGPHYERLSEDEFPWEHRPPRPLGGLADDSDEPRLPVPSAVDWSEPRFDEAEPASVRPERPDSNSAYQGPSRKRWITDFPPRAVWRDDAWALHSGLRFIDAWDAYEWVQERGLISGRFWEGPIGVDSWGAYKNAKVGFRVVLITP